MEERIDPALAVHEALKDYLDPGELLLTWGVTLEIALPSGGRYLAHRYGAGMDGTDLPTLWNIIGLHKAALITAEEQLKAWTVDHCDCDDCEGDDDD